MKRVLLFWGVLLCLAPLQVSQPSETESRRYSLNQETWIRHTAAETRSFAKQLGLKSLTTPVTSPQSNEMAESFVKTLKRDYAKLAYRPDSQTVMAQLQKWFVDYNSYHPHSALGYVPPKLFREKRAVN